MVLDLRPLQCGYAGKGIGRCTLELASRVASAAETSIGEVRYQIFSLVMEGRENPLPKIPVLLTAPVWKRPWLWDQVWLPCLLLIHRVHTFHNFVALGPLPQVSFPVLCRYRGIAEIHDWHMFSESATPIEKFYRQTWRMRIQKLGLPGVHRIVVHSELVRSETIRNGVPPHRITLVPLGCDHLDKVVPEPLSQENFVLSVGDTPNKNLAFTRSVLTLLRSRSILLDWIIIGNRELVLKQLEIPTGQVPEWIKILGSPPDGLLKACYQKALALVFPSTHEGFGIPVMEAMRLGCPVLTTNIEPMKSLLLDVPGLLPVNDASAWSQALSRLQQDSIARRSLAEAGHRRSEAFTWDKAAEKLLHLY